MAYLRCIKDSGRNGFAYVIMSGLNTAFLLTNITISAVLGITPAQTPTETDRVALAVKRLQSPDDVERQAAKEEIIQIGSAAISSLLSLLEDIFRNPNKLYFATGKEIEGADAVQRWEDGISKDYPSNLEIGWRLRDDAYELLGRLRAVESVPLLLRIAESRESFARFSTLTAEMRVLVEIGPPLVPLLIEEMEKAKERAASIRFGDPQPTQEEKTRFINGEAAKMRARAARILGEIGDKRALPSLEKLLEQSSELDSWRPDLPFIEGAIKRIKEKNTTNSNLK